MARCHTRSTHQILNPLGKCMSALGFLLDRYIASCTLMFLLVNSDFLEASLNAYPCLFTLFSFSDFVFLQFKVLRDGCWTKISVRRGETPSRIANDPRDISVNPWVRHYRSGHRHQSHQTVASPSLQGKAILDSTNPFYMLQPNPCNHDSADSNTGSSHLYLNELHEALLASAWLLMIYFAMAWITFVHVLLKYLCAAA